jgi:hypothetical protein
MHSFSYSKIIYSSISPRGRKPSQRSWQSSHTCMTYIHHSKSYPIATKCLRVFLSCWEYRVSASSATERKNMYSKQKYFSKEAMSAETLAQSRGNAWTSQLMFIKRLKITVPGRAAHVASTYFLTSHRVGAVALLNDGHQDSSGDMGRL